MRCSAFLLRVVSTIVLSLSIMVQASGESGSSDHSEDTVLVESNEENEENQLSELENSMAGASGSEADPAKGNEDISTGREKRNNTKAEPLKDLSSRKIIPLDIQLKSKLDVKTGVRYPIVGADKIIEILTHIPNIQEHFFEDGQFIGEVRPLSKEEYGVSTDFLYVVSARDDTREGDAGEGGNAAVGSNKKLAFSKTQKPMFIVKGISKSNAQEVHNLEQMNTMKILNHVPLNLDFPVLTRPEVLYSYTLRVGNSDEKETRYLSVLHLAKGKALKNVIEDVFANTAWNESQKINVLKSIFYQLGASIASFNQHCAGVGENVSIEELNDCLPFVHEDLHFGNIYVYKKSNQMNTSDMVDLKKRWGKSMEGIDLDAPMQKILLSHPYRIYLIDNETVGRENQRSWYTPQWAKSVDKSGTNKWVKTKPLMPRRVAGQFQMLYGWSLFGQNNIRLLSDHAIYALYYEGLIKGYASKFSRRHRVGVVAYLVNELEMLNSMLLSPEYRKGLRVLTRLEKSLLTLLEEKSVLLKLTIKIKGVQELLKKKKSCEAAERSAGMMPVRENTRREETPTEDPTFFPQAETTNVIRGLPF